ncbi:protein adenylyltransferase SelO [Desulfosediminicola flagellatus]|uniref:protein adenylyltransferase SelO n=1 Tax=Desulfosediminicola flagellatus TaxID=2569541 RepID=UPI0010ABDA39|nr:YdiU family protein [Desulfosediminicola flagellatus]
MTKNTPEFPLAKLHFDNAFTRELPADPLLENMRRQVTGSCYSRVKPTKVAQPSLIAYAREVADLLDLDKDSCMSELFTEVFSGNSILTGMDPFAMCYGGHQFGNWAGQLGDGRAINLGEIVNSRDERWVLQLKGAGPTPYSRRADGLAVLRSSVREFLCSEAMYHLGVPTTRALSLIDTGEPVLRDMFYDGHPEEEPGAIVCRVAPSFLRFGNYEILASRGDKELLKRLADYTIKTDFPHLDQTAEDIYLQWFSEVCSRTARLIVHWMRVGFVHGVMNTDNMSILGLTIDYGPYGWLEDYDPEWTPNTTDSVGKRYAFSNQGLIAQWNLVQLANTLYPLINDATALQSTLDNAYTREFTSGWKTMMANKIGLDRFIDESDTHLIKELTDILQEAETDMTIFFRQLAKLDISETLDISQVPEQLIQAYYRPEQLTPVYLNRLHKWFKDYRHRFQAGSITNSARTALMDRTNPKYVLRNYLAQEAIDKAANGDNSGVHELLELLRRPYDEQPEMEKQYYRKRPEWARHKPGCSMLS